ncbi:MAG TPA: metalloregulator ArsR/SmtB family transcription factor [Polyangiaceae bacterium]|nr:metalloregulator ArsR/SmtB family transcription factor [Polyangiaceae bacterium]
MNRIARQPNGAECEPRDHPARPLAEQRFSEQAFVRAAGFFRVAGDVSRLKLLARLAEGEWCVTELAHAAGLALPTVSQQLRLLRAEALVTRRRVAKHVYYSLADRHIQDLIVNALEHGAEEPSTSDDG